MTTTTFLDQQTVIQASWLNDVNNVTYTTVPALNTSVTSLNTTKANAGANTDITSLGTVTTTTQANGTTNTSIATTAFVTNSITNIPSSTQRQVQNVSAVASANTIIASVNPGTFDFRSTTLNVGIPNSRTLSAISNITIPQGATLGAVSASTTRIVIGGIDNAGTVEPFVAGTNVDLSEGTLVNTTAISNAANSSNVFYTTTARTLVPFRALGFFDSNQSTAGTYAAQPLLVQGIGGNVIMQGVGNNANASYDTPLSVGQQVFIDISAQTSVPLKIACGDNQVYEIQLELTGNTGASANTLLLPNNNSGLTNLFLFGITTVGSFASGYVNGLMLGYNSDIRNGFARVSTKTTSKNVTFNTHGISAGSVYGSIGGCSWVAVASTLASDTTTAWTSLGTITFPVAATGRILIRRVA